MTDVSSTFGRFGILAVDAKLIDADLDRMGKQLCELASHLALCARANAVAEETLNRDIAELRVWYAAGSIKESVGVTK